jgi:hypothetical protein
MPLIIPVGFGQAVYTFSLLGDDEPVVCTLGHDLTEAGSNYESAANDLLDMAGLNMMDQITSHYTLQSVTLYVGQDGGPPAIYESSDTGHQGGAVQAPLPQNCAQLVRKRTGAAGRRGRGRMYWPGIIEGNVSETGVIASGYLADLQSNANAWHAALLAGLGGVGPALPPVILHRSEGIGTEPPPTPVTSFQVDNVIATQRQRLRR